MTRPWWWPYCRCRHLAAHHEHFTASSHCSVKLGPGEYCTCRRFRRAWFGWQLRVVAR